MCHCVSARYAIRLTLVRRVNNEETFMNRVPTTITLRVTHYIILLE